MYKVAIIGAGQLGSRHLQGLKTAVSPLSISVVDSSNESLQVAKERYDTVQAVGEKEVTYLTSIDKLPEELDLVIVATGSKPRAAIVKSLLSAKNVKNIVLEKVLFPAMADYDEIDQLLKEKSVKCWVNCPRRMYGLYQQIAGIIDKNKPVMMFYGEENWGLCCNSIHEIDIFMYLTGEDNYTIDTSLLNTEIEASKRNGYIEMTGTLRIKTPNGSELILTSINGYERKAGITIQNGDMNLFIDESKGLWSLNGEEHNFAVPYQSQLSGVLADDLLSKGDCPLSTYKLSASYHKPFIEALLLKYNIITAQKENKLLPIT